MELLRLLNDVDVVDLSEASKLHHEVRELKILNSKFEENFYSLLVEEMAVDEKAFNLLADNLGFMTEYESLSSDVKVRYFLDSHLAKTLDSYLAMSLDSLLRGIFEFAFGKDFGFVYWDVFGFAFANFHCEKWSNDLLVLHLGDLEDLNAPYNFLQS
ncbi:hypothetical protein AgCh_034111 [Apium graveolens]